MEIETHDTMDRYGHGVIQSDLNGVEIRRWDTVNSIIVEYPLYDAHRIRSKGINRGKPL